jgi:poly(hydroxyalkanoate) depolymerase family esterase
MRFLRVLAAASVAATALVVLGAQTGQAAGLTEVTGFGSNPGNLRMFTYVPAGLATSRPLVVVLHGCTQSAAVVDDETGWAKWADTYQFALVLPEQKTPNNPSRCFNWWLPGDQSRGGGESLSVKQMTDWMKTTYGSDAARVFVTGLSAGGAMTDVMLATYPDVFSAGAVVGGVPYKCATTAAQTSACNNGTTNLTPVQWGDKVRGAFPSWTGPWPRVSVWHGTADTTVAPMNLTEIMEQWTNVNGIDQTADTTNTVAGYPHNIYKDAGGGARVETYSITGMGHGQPIDPGTGATQCGVATGYNLDVNICASYYIANWFGIAP